MNVYELIEINKKVFLLLWLFAIVGFIAAIYDELHKTNTFSYVISIVIAIALIMAYYNLYVYFKTKNKGVISHEQK